MQYEIKERIHIDLSKNRSDVCVYARQGDTMGRTISAIISNGGDTLQLDNLVYAEIEIRKADGTEVRNACVRESNEIIYTLRTNDVAAEGEAIAWFILTYKDGTVVKTPEFSIIVRKQDITIAESKNDFDTINQILANVAGSEDRAKEYAEEAKNQADLVKNYKDQLPDDLYDVIEEQNSILEATKQVYSNAAENAAGQVIDEVFEKLQPITSEEDEEGDIHIYGNIVGAKPEITEKYFKEVDNELCMNLESSDPLIKNDTGMQIVAAFNTLAAKVREVFNNG